MPEVDARKRVHELLAQGLDFYARGDAESAVACWREVLHLDPDSEEARDYLADAGAEESPTLGEAPLIELEERTDIRAQALLADAVAAVRGGDPERAYELLQALAEREPGDLEVQGYFELVRASLAERYRSRLGDATCVYDIVSRAQLFDFNLPAEAGYLASLMNGEMTLGAILDAAAIDRFSTLRTLSKLLESGVIEVRS